VVTEEAANLDMLKTVKDYGFIVLNTHGLIGASSSIPEVASWMV
jgi:hypothetical protein